MPLVFLVYRNQSKNINVTEIIRDIYEAERTQDIANDELEKASNNADMARAKIADVKSRKNIHFLLPLTCLNLNISAVAAEQQPAQHGGKADEPTSRRPADKDQRNTNKDRSEPEDGSRGQGGGQLGSAGRHRCARSEKISQETWSAQMSSSLRFLTFAVTQEMRNVTSLFEDLKQKNASQTIQGDAAKRLKDIVDEVEKMKKDMEDKNRQIQGTHPPSASRLGQMVKTVSCACGQLCVPSVGGQDPSTHQDERAKSS